MSKYTKSDIWRMIEEEDVEFIRLQFTDLFGMLKNVAVTTSQLERVLQMLTSLIFACIRIWIRLQSFRGGRSMAR